MALLVICVLHDVGFIFSGIKLSILNDRTFSNMLRLKQHHALIHDVA